jgi:UDP-GlcNAc:undecaprenyl-phosphate/decaprenyl-phosphate GlcNAc-1-phosphate transferase
MFALIPVIFSSLIVCFVLTPFFRDFFGFLGIVDRPDSHRKAHVRPIPRVGGIALIVTYFVAFVTLALGWWQGLFDPHDPAIRLVAKLSPAIVLIFVVGLYDDLWGLSPWQKLAGQFGAAAYASWVGIRLATPPGYTGPAIAVELVGIFWLVLCANAFNLIDGLDGLATGVALIASASLLLAAMIHHNPGLALVITPLIGALLGFLYYNFNPASIFLGDCGSLLIGFLLGCYGLMWNQHANTGLGMFAPFVALAFPVFEVALSVFRRFLRNRPIFGSDRNHIHHRILSLGLSQRDTALVLYGVAALVAVVAVLQTILQPQIATVLLLLFLAAGYFGFRLLRYPEFGILGRFLFAGGFRRTLRSSIHLHEYEESLAAAKTVEECWLVLKNTCWEANFSYVSMRVNGRYFENELQPALTAARRLHVTLSRSAEATFEHEPSLAAQAMLIAPLADRLQEKLSRFNTTPARLGPDAPPCERPKASRAVAG